MGTRDGKVALVIGGGRRIALMLAGAGAAMAVLGRDMAKLDRCPRGD
jgi:hypothetical protein